MFSDFALNDRLLKALAAMEFTEPTLVQARVIPVALKGKDLMVSAETGSGKTAAFMLPTLHRFLAKPAPYSSTRALILVPTRELAQQVFKHCNKLADFSPIKAGLITGGAGFKFQMATLRKNPEILVATPGRLVEHLEKGTPDFKDLEVLVLDEADRMLDMGFSADVLKIVSYCKSERQTLLFSATLNHRGIAAMVEGVLHDPETLTLNTVRDERPNIRQQIVLADDLDHKQQLTTWLLQNDAYKKALVFVNSKPQTDAVAEHLRAQGLKAGALHSDLDQPARKRIMDLLHRGAINVLVATDIASRGIDVKVIDLVINFDMARNGDDYIHRIGRTGRAGEQGLAISLINAREWNQMASIERYTQQSFERRVIKALQGKFKGPKKLKSSGKATGAKKPKSAAKQNAVKPKQRLRDKKNIGKRRKPSGDAPETTLSNSGFGPLKKKG